MIKSQNFISLKQIQIGICGLFALLLSSCEQGEKSTGGRDSSPSTLSIYRSMEYVKSTSTYFNFIPDSTGLRGPISKFSTTGTVSGGSVDIQLNGQFIYKQESGTIGIMVINYTSGALTGAVDATVPIDQLDEVLGSPVEIRDELTISWIPDPSGNPTIGTYSQRTTKTNNQTITLTGTIQFKSIFRVTETSE